jgi:hypothetical protein
MKTKINRSRIRISLNRKGIQVCEMKMASPVDNKFVPYDDPFGPINKLSRRDKEIHEIISRIKIKLYSIS